MSEVFSQYVLDDLSRSGLKPTDVAARPLTGSELAASDTLGSGRIPEGYVLPYFDLNGKPVPFYRIKFLESQLPKYKQKRDSENHIYFPKDLPVLLNKLQGSGKLQYILVTEGEKKAACAVAVGIPTVAVTGVDSWRNRVVSIPDISELKAYKQQGIIKAKLPQGDTNDMVRIETGNLARGLDQLIDYIVSHRIHVIICFDTDKGGIKPDVQRAAAQLGYEFRYRGIPISNIRQLILPFTNKSDKIGLDDFLVRRGKETFVSMINATIKKRGTFPRHPTPRTFVATRLQKGRLSRKEQQDVALAVMMELEARGKRLQNEATEEMYYFDEQSHTLMHVALGNPRIMLHETNFGSYLYREFNLSAQDQKVIGWLAAQFTGEPGIERTKTHKVTALTEVLGVPDVPRGIAIQISDSHFVLVTDNPNKPYRVELNGTFGLLFEQGQVSRIDHTALTEAIDTQLTVGKPEMKWLEVLKHFNFQPVFGSSDASADDLRQLAALLFYISPWLLRWKGTQLPVELIVGEAGSGKSSLYQLRQTVITGKPSLANLTNDIRDWYAGITSRGGVYVMDNVHFTGTNKDYRQRLSDELCRLITEPQPHIELRKLYTTSDVAALPVNATFAVTSIEQSFFNTDLLQRAALFEVSAIRKTHDSKWVDHMLEMHGGRIGWLAHQVVILHKFLRRVSWEQQWDDTYQAGHRLGNYEQCMVQMARVFGIESSWIPDALQTQVNVSVSESDWTMQAIKDYVDELKITRTADWQLYEFGAKEICVWADAHENHCKNSQATNPHRLGKYIRSHLAALKSTLNVVPARMVNNRQMFQVIERKEVA